MDDSVFNFEDAWVKISARYFTCGDTQDGRLLFQNDIFFSLCFPNI